MRMYNKSLINRDQKRVILWTLIFFSVFDLCFMRSSLAQEKKCALAFAKATEEYDKGNLGEAETLITNCLKIANPTSEEKLQAYELLGLVYLSMQNREEAAKNVIKKLLAINPDYEPNPNDLKPDYVDFVKKVKEELKRAAAQFVPVTNTALYSHSYALVVGINKYVSKNLPELKYAKRDAEAVAAFLKDQGFEVIALYDRQATRAAIISTMENDLANRVQKDDRVLFFFAGHGDVKKRSGKDFGHIVPYDGDAIKASNISMEDLRSQSEKMGNAKHQLFILDACYGGLLGMRSTQEIKENVNPRLIAPATAPDKIRGVNIVPKIAPSYILALTTRPARQVLTAGGTDQQVLDVGPKGHSYFTTYLLEALQEGRADTVNRDGYITFTEVYGYLQTKASNGYQTPGYWNLEGHGGGDFVFISPKGPRIKSQIQVVKPENKPRSKKWLWIGGGLAVGGGAAILILSGGGDGETPVQDGFVQPPGRPR